MEKKIQELKTKLLNDLEMFMHNSIEQFTSLLSDISNEYLVKTKERELELKDEVKKLDNSKIELEKWMDDNNQKALDYKDAIEGLEKYKLEIARKTSEIEKIEKENNSITKTLATELDRLQKEKDAFEKEKQQFQVQKAMVEEQVKTLRKLNI
jgi:chromosome segregation ATPase